MSAEPDNKILDYIMSDTFYCPYCERAIDSTAKQCSTCGLIFKPEYTSPSVPPSPTSEAEKNLQFLCVNCWAFRDVSESGKCIKCGSGSILDREKCSKL